MIRFLSSLHKNFFIDCYSKQFIEFCRQRWSNKNLKFNSKILLVELYPVDQTILSFSYFANIFAKKSQSKIVSFSLSTKNNYIFYFFNRRILNIYKSFNVLGHINTIISASLMKDVDIIFNNEMARIKSKNDIFNVSIFGISIGEEIYEAYLIEKSKPTIDIYSSHFRRFFYLCIKTFIFWWDYFNKYVVSGVILSHGIYRYGIIKKIATTKKIPIYLPTIRSLFCLSFPNDLPIKPFKKYPFIFNKLSKADRRKGVSWAKNRLKLRFSGKIGVDMSYSTKSAFKKVNSRKKILRDSKNIKILIATHDFFDNPNAYGRNIFPDFYEWICFLGEMSEITNYDWYLKTHPDVSDESIAVIDKILKKYTKIHKIPSDSSHIQLANEGINFVTTVYGTVGHEYPLLGPIVINAGNKNPHIGYRFNIHCKTFTEYKKYLLNLENVKCNFSKEEIYEFYFTHYKLLGNNDFFLNDFEKAIKAISKKGSYQSLIYKYYIDQYKSSGDSFILSKMKKFIDKKLVSINQYSDMKL